MRNEPLLIRVHRLSEPNGECIVWTGARVGGYGFIHLRHPRRNELVHRVVWREINGPIPAGLCVLHHCDNPPCFRPEHLFLGTRADNNMDKVRKGRAARKLTRDSVMELRELRKRGWTYKALAERFGVATMTAYRTANGQRWRHV